MATDAPQDPFDLLDGVQDEASFIAFVEALASDFARELKLEAETPSSPYGPGALGWENSRIDSMLEAAASYADSTRNPSAPDPNPWHRCAEILYMGKIYE
jgi:hypothetical protein